MSTVSIGLPDFGHDARYLRPSSKRPIPRRRPRRGWRRLAVNATRSLLAVLLILAAREGVVRFMASDAFLLSEVIVEGCSRSTPDEIRALVEGVSSRNLFQLDLAEARGLAESHRWIRHAEIGRRLPDTLALTVTERTPSALALIDGRPMLVDEEGVALDECGATFETCDFPVLTGLSGRTDEERDRIVLGVAALRAIGTVAPAFAARISEVDLSRPDRLTVLTGDGATPLYLSPREHARNIENFLRIEREIHDSFERLEYVDLRFRGRIAVMPSAQAVRARASGRGR